MEIMKCPECGLEFNENTKKCIRCGFELEIYKNTYDRVYAEKKRTMDEDYTALSKKSSDKHIPRCPFCNSSNLTRITTFEKIINIALFGLYGNKRRYQWHCNSCNTNW